MTMLRGILRLSLVDICLLINYFKNIPEQENVIFVLINHIF